MEVRRALIIGITAAIRHRQSKDTDMLPNEFIMPNEEQHSLLLYGRVVHEGWRKQWLLCVLDGELLATVPETSRSLLIAPLGDPLLYDHLAEFLRREFGCTGIHW